MRTIQDITLRDSLELTQVTQYCQDKDSETQVATMGWALMQDERDKVCIKNFGGETLLRRPRRRWQVNIKVDLKATSYVFPIGVTLSPLVCRLYYNIQNSKWRVL